MFDVFCFLKLCGGTMGHNVNPQEQMESLTCLKKRHYLLSLELTWKWKTTCL